MPAVQTDDPRWARILTRDAAADGLFWFSVSTTGIYCRPSCPSRRPLRTNVAIHDSVAAARATGARACRRCNPEGSSQASQNGALIEQACRAIEQAETPPSLAQLADRAELSPAYFHRLFKSLTGVTPKAYAVAHRAGRVRAALAEGETVTQAIHAAGFGSSSRFYEGAAATLGMAPGRYRAGGVDEVLRFSSGRSSLGLMLVAASARGIAAILLGDDAAALAADLRARFPQARLIGDDADFAEDVRQVIASIDMPAAGLELPLDIRGTAFQQRVWQALRAIPAGQTATYAEVAGVIGQPKAARAVAAACAANAHAIAIPCHRVIHRDGTLSGYRWGAERKRALLDREAAG